MGNMADIQRQTFQARIKRIEKGGPNTMGHILIGPQDDTVGKTKKPKKVRKGQSFGQRLSAAIADLFIMPISFALGGFAMLTGLVATVQFKAAGIIPAEAEGLQAQMIPYADVMIALIVGLTIGGLLRLSKGQRKIALFVGIAAVFFGQDALMATYPDVFDRLMSPEAALPLPAEALSGL